MSGPLITDEYRAQQKALHAVGNYGRAAMSFGHLVAGYVQRLRVGSLLDYGCGSQRSLLKVLKLPEHVVYEGYDPCVPEYSTDPIPAELVVCIDVLEHIEPQLLDNVLDHLKDLCDPYGLFTIHTGPAAKVLSDGRNAHLTQEDISWWLPKLEQRFHVIEYGPTTKQGFFTFVRARTA
jgi:hypothetical protein